MENDLIEPFQSALREADLFIRRGYDPIGIVAGGTILRGEWQANSDLDFVVIHQASWRQRVQIRLNTVPIELFVNPAAEFRHAMQREAAAGRPAMTHLIASGKVLLDDMGVIQTLRREAREILERGPVIPREGLQARDYANATLFEDAVDIIAIDPERSRSMMTEAIARAAELWFLRAGRWLPRTKLLFSELEKLAPTLGADVRSAIRTAGEPAHLAFTMDVVTRLGSPTGFFEWTSTPEDRPGD
jgi:hypothetical protein